MLNLTASSLLKAAIVLAGRLCWRFIPKALDFYSSPLFTRLYAYDGDDLGAVVKGDVTEFKVWSPTAKRIVLNLYSAGNDGDAYAHIEMRKGKKSVWMARVFCGHGTYYTYSVTHHGRTVEAVDIYVKAAGVNGERGMVVDLLRTDPKGFRESDFVRNITNYGEAVIWEVTVRDFSSALTSSAYPGKYLAFTESGLVNESGIPVGLDWLRWLGITHVQLQPVFAFHDYFCETERGYDPEAYTWGYFTRHYFAPEGSYSTDPFHGEVHIYELKRLIQTLHKHNIGVVLDVSYNHTEKGLSNFQKLVPDYYYRFWPNGDTSDGAGLGNETESRHTMFRKFMLDNLSYWLTEYKVDGFRLDAMSLHDTETLQLVEQTVHGINPNALLYGEAWNAGPSVLPEEERGYLTNIRRIRASDNAVGGLAVFEYCVRDGLMGKNVKLDALGYALGAPDEANANWVAFGIDGCRQEGVEEWTVSDNMVLHYISCHDDYTVYDRLTFGHPDRNRDWVLRTNRMAASVVMLSRGTPFLLAGEEMLRTKYGDGNSVHSSPELNSIKWEALVLGSDAWEMACFYRDLFAMRRDNAFFTAGKIAVKVRKNLCIDVKWYTDEGELCACALLNPHEAAVWYECPSGSWKALLKDGRICSGIGETLQGTVAVSPQSVLILHRSRQE